METSSGLFMFLAAGAVAVFAFLSVAVWVTGPAQERRERDRLALLKTLAEQPGENAARVLDMLIEEDRRREQRRFEEERRGYIIGGLSAIASGAGLSLMLAMLKGGGTWSVGAIPFLVGCVILGAGLLNRPPGSRRG